MNRSHEQLISLILETHGEMLMHCPEAAAVGKSDTEPGHSVNVADGTQLSMQAVIGHNVLAFQVTTGLNAMYN